MSFALLYNAVVIPLRASIVQVQGITFEHTGWWNGSPTVVSLWKLLIWIFIDLLFDVVYLMDIVLVESRVSVPIEKSKRNGRIGNNSKNVSNKNVTSQPHDILIDFLVIFNFNRYSQNLIVTIYFAGHSGVM